MAEEESKINPWARADLERPNPETEALIPVHLRENYHYVLEELAQSAVALTEASVRFEAARAARALFFTTILEKL